MPRQLIGNVLLTLVLFIASAAVAELQVSFEEKYLSYSGDAVAEPRVSFDVMQLSYEDVVATKADGSPFTIPFFPSTANSFGRQGFARIVNRSDRSGTVEITAFDDSGRRYGPATLSLDPRRTVHFNSGDLEDGNADKIAVGVGPASQGDWRLELSSDLDISVLSYIRTRDGFVTSMHDVAPSKGDTHGISFFNPGSNTSQVSYLRVVNTGSSAVAVMVLGVDDAGDAAPGGTVRFEIPAHGARTFDAHELEEGAAGLDGALGDGVGKWRLVVEADRPIIAMSMLGTPTGHLTNLSTDPGYVETEIPDGAPPAPTVTAVSATEIRAEWKREYRSGDPAVFDTQVRPQGGSWQSFCNDFRGGTSGTVTYQWTVSGVAPNTTYEVRYRYRPSGSCDSGTPGTWSGIGSARTPPDSGGGDAPPAPTLTALSATEVRAEWVWEYRAGESDVFDVQGRPQGGSWELSQDFGGGASGTFDYTVTFTGLSPDTTYDGRYRHRPSGSCNSGTPGTWSGIASVQTPSAGGGGGGGTGSPDLLVESVSVSDSSPDTGTSFTLRATVRNGGDGSADATTLRYYRSSNSTISIGDTEVGTDPVSALASSATSAESISLTAPSSAGTYYYGACVDSVSASRIRRTIAPTACVCRLRMAWWRQSRRVRGRRHLRAWRRVRRLRHG